MGSFEDLLLGVGGYISHDSDFSFEKNKGELANSIRAKFLDPATRGLPSEFKEIDIDDDGDIAVRTERCSVYFSSSSLFLTGWTVTPKEISEGSDIAELSKALESLLALRHPFRPIEYQVRLFLGLRFALRSEPPPALSRCSQSGLQPILGASAPQKVKQYNVGAQFNRGLFSDSFEVEISRMNAEVRYTRGAVASEYASFGVFLGTADLPGLIDDIKPFLKELISDPSRLSSRTFRTLGVPR